MAGGALPGAPCDVSGQPNRSNLRFAGSAYFLGGPGGGGRRCLGASALEQRRRTVRGFACDPHRHSSWLPILSSTKGNAPRCRESRQDSQCSQALPARTRSAHAGWARSIEATTTEGQRRCLSSWRRTGRNWLTVPPAHRHQGRGPLRPHPRRAPRGSGRSPVGTALGRPSRRGTRTVVLRQRGKNNLLALLRNRPAFVTRRSGGRRSNQAAERAE